LEVLGWNRTNVTTAKPMPSIFEQIHASDVQIDLIFTALTMPGVDGQTLVPTLRAVADPIPVIVMSAAPIPNELRRVVPSVQKPFDLDKLSVSSKRTSLITDMAVQSSPQNAPDVVLNCGRLLVLAVPAWSRFRSLQAKK
jgi:CheY-like chemotaxis protein